MLHDCCPLADENLPEKAGLLWIGEKFYETPHDFLKEAAEMGISRRLPAVPKDFTIGEDSVLLAHRCCIAKPKPKDEEVATWSIDECVAYFKDRKWKLPPDEEIEHEIEASVAWHMATIAAIAENKPDFNPGIFTIFKPTHMEYVCKGDESQDELKSLVDRGIKPVIVQRDITGDDAEDRDDETEFNGGSD
jgi:hypothetical protein